MSFTDPFEVIRDDFKKRGIHQDRPGFYDDPNFVKHEKINPKFLNNCARYVQQQRYDFDYLEKARKEIPVIARAIHGELLEDGRQGACVDTSGVMSRILEKEGFWSFCIKGYLTITYPDTTGIENRYFWSVDVGEFVAGHAWIFAPPYCVVDITLKEQPHTVEELRYLPDYIFAVEMEVVQPNVANIISPIVRHYLTNQGASPDRHLDAVNTNIKEFLSVFDAYSVPAKNVKLKYVPIAVGASDCPLEDMIGISPTGKSGISIYRDVVLPKLRMLRD